MSILKFVTWNVDGLDGSNIISRAHSACSTLLETNPDVIFLQEVVHQNNTVFKTILENNEYISVTEPPGNSRYFTSCFVKKNIQIIEFERIPLYSYMNRDIIKLNIWFNDVKVCLLNSHLESMKESSAIRIAQFEQMIYMSFQEYIPVIIAGDLNMRDYEAKQALQNVQQVIGAINLNDAYFHFGRPKTASKTWIMPGNPVVGCRFDRVYHNCHPQIQHDKMQLIGKKGTSDHFGIYMDFCIQSERN
jgi:endonuclease/exonuclease/phosphatase family metal-dependent hydrolase